MSLSLNLNAEQRSVIAKSILSGLSCLKSVEPLKLSDYANKYFYLSPESSYIEGEWETMPYQKSIMDCMGNDDIREVNIIKSARIGYTKMLVASVAYFAEHKKRNIAIWQPVDDDADSFCKTEIDPMLRDCEVIRKIFPYYDKKHKNNTMVLKVFNGSSLHIRGGKAAKNYRRISVDVGIIDELDGFDHDIEQEGPPRKLAGKRIEGATFPKMICGSTPGIKKRDGEVGGSQIEDAVQECEHFFKFHIPCPHCNQFQNLEFGGKDVPYGLKWEHAQPSTAHYVCKYCRKGFAQDDYLNRWGKGIYKTDNGVWIDEENTFRDSSNNIIEAPLRVAFHIWTIYSSMTSWSLIVREFLDAKDDQGKLKAFVNTTLGETWDEGETEKLEQAVLYTRREHYQAEVPNEVIVLTAGIDVQDDRFELQVDGWGLGEERWGISYSRLFGDPSRATIWDKLGEKLRRGFKKVDGSIINIKLACQDHGGHYSDEVNKFSARAGKLFLIPIKGSSQYSRPVAMFPRKPNKNGVYLTEVGTDTAKELLYQRLKILNPGPGYWHFPVSDEFDEEYFTQLTNEERVPKYEKGVKRWFWDARSRRNEAWDCSVYSLAAIRILQQYFGINLETTIKPPVIGGRSVRSKGIF